jgi:hypothetical protein
MDVRLQAKLLRAIQKRVIDRVGGGKPIPVDIRIIATSNLALAVCVGDFREAAAHRAMRWRRPYRHGVCGFSETATCGPVGRTWPISSAI